MDENLITTEQFIASRSYYSDTLTWCVREKSPIPRWKNIYHLCSDPIVFILYGFMCFACVFTAYFLQQFEDLQPKWDWFRITFAGICCCVGSTTYYKPKTFSNRNFFLFLLFGNMIFVISFISCLIQLVSAAIYDHQIESVREMLDDSFELLCDEFTFQHLIKQNEVIWFYSILIVDIVVCFIIVCFFVYSIFQTYPSRILDRIDVCKDLQHCLNRIDRNGKLAFG